MFRSGSDWVEYKRVGPSRGHKIYFFRVWSGSGQDLTRLFEVGVPKTLPRRTLHWCDTFSATSSALPIIPISNNHSEALIRGRFKTQPAVDRPEPPLLAGCYCSESFWMMTTGRNRRFLAVAIVLKASERWQPAGTGGSRRSTVGWVLKPSLTCLIVQFNP